MMAKLSGRQRGSHPKVRAGWEHEGMRARWEHEGTRVRWEREGTRARWEHKSTRVRWECKGKMGRQWQQSVASQNEGWREGQRERQQCVAWKRHVHEEKIISASRSTTINEHTLNSLHKWGPLWSETLSWELSERYLFVGGKREEGRTKVWVRRRWLKCKDGK